MNDYIKREDVILAIRRRLPAEPFMKRNWDKWFKENEDLVLLDEEVCNLPRADVAPVRHGHWEVIDAEEPRRYGCSECKRLSWHMDNYCLHCGARMDGESDDE